MCFTVALGPSALRCGLKKGGVGKSTNATLFALLARQARRQVLLIDLDPASATSRDFLGREIATVPQNLSTYLAQDLPAPPPVISSGVEGLDLVVSNPQADSLFRHFPEHSTKLRDGLALLPPIYDWIIMDVPHAYDNIAHLGLIAADYVLLPVELSLDCLDRIDMVLAMLEDVRAHNPRLTILGAEVHLQDQAEHFGRRAVCVSRVRAAVCRGEDFDVPYDHVSLHDKCRRCPCECRSSITSLDGAASFRAPDGRDSYPHHPCQKASFPHVSCHNKPPTDASPRGVSSHLNVSAKHFPRQQATSK